jgi:hypothetical protein
MIRSVEEQLKYSVSLNVFHIEFYDLLKTIKSTLYFWELSLDLNAIGVLVKKINCKTG